MIMTQFSIWSSGGCRWRSSNCRTWWWKDYFNKALLVYASCGSKWSRKTCTPQNNWVKIKSPSRLPNDSMRLDLSLTNEKFHLAIDGEISPGKPRWIIVVFHTDKSGNQQCNPSIFDHCNLTNMFVMLNSRRYPEIDYEDTNFAQQKFSRVYGDAAAFRTKF